jgi:transposase
MDMPRKSKEIQCDMATRKELERIANGQKEEIRMVQRARIILDLLDGKQIKTVAAEQGVEENTVTKWRDRFDAKGLAGLRDAPRSGKPRTYDEEWERKVIAKLDEPPPEGLTKWDQPTLARVLNTSEDAIQRFFQRQGIQLSRMRSWCVSTDPEFAEKAADIVGLYMAPNENAVVICVDEKPSIQALSRRVGYVKTRNGKKMRAINSTYRRNGTRNLFAALEVATGIIHGKTTATKKRVDFLDFMDELLLELPQRESVEYHVIVDNYCIHKRCDEWLELHKNVRFHYTPTSASWLNMVEIWFNIMSRKILRGASFDSTDALADAMKKYIAHYNESAEPFVWKKREVTGSQIKNTISNLYG